MYCVNLTMSFLIILILLASGGSPAESARVITIVNNCRATIWPAVTPGDSFNGGGFFLAPGQTVVFTAPARWVGRIWARTGCEFDQSGNGSCQTGACGTALKCAAASGLTPASLAEFTLGHVCSGAPDDQNVTESMPKRLWTEYGVVEVKKASAKIDAEDVISDFDSNPLAVLIYMDDNEI
ncbi:hypothetical protein Taro_011844 [Colocasia esculenta]|uniref:Pathogenesis-related protein 5 n=1 Tax=Colocasia esculenta TaxID=4460 RepID=A0A843UH98_COLES|nr:hypothetical protein [Colocasia esculenta]